MELRHGIGHGIGHGSAVPLRRKYLKGLDPFTVHEQGSLSQKQKEKRKRRELGGGTACRAQKQKKHLTG